MFALLQPLPPCTFLTVEDRPRPRSDVADWHSNPRAIGVLTTEHVTTTMKII